MERNIVEAKLKAKNDHSNFGKVEDGKANMKEKAKNIKVNPKD